MTGEPTAHPRPLSDRRLGDRRLAKLGKELVDGVSGHRPRERDLEAAGLNAHVGRDQKKGTHSGQECGMDACLQVDVSPSLSDGQRHCRIHRANYADMGCNTESWLLARVDCGPSDADIDAQLLPLVGNPPATS